MSAVLDSAVANKPTVQQSGDTIVGHGSGDTLAGQDFSPLQEKIATKREPKPSAVDRIASFFEASRWNPTLLKAANHLLKSEYGIKREIENTRTDLTSRFLSRFSRKITDQVNELNNSIENSVHKILDQIAATRRTVLKFAGEFRKEFGGEYFRIGFENGEPMMKTSTERHIPVPAPLMAAVVPAEHLNRMQSIETLCTRILKNEQINARVEKYGSEPKLTALTITNKLGEKMTLIEVHPGRFRFYRTIDGHELEYAGSFWNALPPETSGKKQEFRADSIIRAFCSGKYEIKVNNDNRNGRYYIPNVGESVYHQPRS
jgi:hypothetical protein